MWGDNGIQAKSAMFPQQKNIKSTNRSFKNLNQINNWLQANSK